MKRVKIVKDGFKCERCGGEWVPKSNKKPTVCPKCYSPYWDRPRKNKRKQVKTKDRLADFYDKQIKKGD